MVLLCSSLSKSTVKVSALKPRIEGEVVSQLLSWFLLKTLDLLKGRAVFIFEAKERHLIFYT